MSKPGVFSSSDLLEVARSLGYAAVPEIVDALATAAERGHHLAVVAGEGSGADMLIGLVTALRCESEADSLQALVVAATREAAVRDAQAVQAIAGRTGLVTRVWEDGREEGTAGSCHVVCGRPAELLTGIRTGHLGLGALRLLVLDGLHDFDAARAWPAAEAILDTVEAETQRVARTAEDDPRFRALVERRLPRARLWPPELFPTPGEEPSPGSGGAGQVVWIATGVGEGARLERLIAALRDPPAGGRSTRAVVGCVDEAAARRVGDSLAVRAFPRAGAPGEEGVFVGWEPAPAVQPDFAALFGLPADLATARSWLEGAGCAVACVELRHIAELEIMLRRLGWTPREAGWPLPADSRDAIEDYRLRIRERAERTDAVSQLSLLAPLVEELGPLQVLAALSDLVRQRAAEAPPSGAPTEGAVRPAWTPVFLNVGKKDGAGPGDIVGAITGETPAVAAQIGKIDVRATHTIVELDSLVADEVIAALQGSRIKGRSVSAKQDRGVRTPASGRPRGKHRRRGG